MIDKAASLFKEHDVDTETIRVADRYIPFGVSSREDERDQWPFILDKPVIMDINTDPRRFIKNE